VVYRYSPTEESVSVRPRAALTPRRRGTETQAPDASKHRFTLDRPRAERDGLLLRRLLAETGSWWPKESARHSEDVLRYLVLNEGSVGRRAHAVTESWLVREPRLWSGDAAVVTEGRWTTTWPLRSGSATDLVGVELKTGGRPLSTSPDESSVVDSVRLWAGIARELTAWLDGTSPSGSSNASAGGDSADIAADLRERNFASPDWASVSAFLASSPDALPVLQELPRQAELAFGAPQDLALDIYVDPEEGARQLVASVLTALDPVDALACLHRLDGDWWLDIAPRMRGALCVTVEYV